MSCNVKFRSGRFMVPATLTYDAGRIYVRFGFDRGLISEIKMFEGAKWHPDIKAWSILDSMRNAFQLSYLCGENPYSHYDQPLLLAESKQPLKEHQYAMFRHSITRRHSIYAAEMGLGKTLSAIAAVEWYHSNITPLEHGDVWYIGPVAGVRAVRRELVKWKHPIPWIMHTYQKTLSLISNWTKGQPAPKIVIFDESSKIKNPNAKQSQCCMHLANSVREEHGKASMCILMSGTPAPKNPADWWHQCEVACPGFLVEGNKQKLEYRLSLVEQRESITGGMYPHKITWLDDEKKCSVCGQYIFTHAGEDHPFTASKNEVAYLHERMKGLVITLFKKDVLDLPEKIYRIIGVKPTVEILQAAKSIKRLAPKAVTAMGWLRELSDGFRYEDTQSEIEMAECRRCHGTGQCTEILTPMNEKGSVWNEDFQAYLQPGVADVKTEQITCPSCEGSGMVPKVERVAKEFGTPKDAVLEEILDDHDDVGRIIIWAGFQASLDRVVKICHKNNWHTLRVDGRGYKALAPDGQILESDELLDAMDLSHERYKELQDKYGKIAFVGHPKAGGMALTLTAAPTEVFFSNSFDGEARIQAEDRAHRIGMDANRGLTIIDLVMLPTDLLVIENLKKKKNLQSMTMGDLDDQWSQMASKIEEYAQ